MGQVERVAVGCEQKKKKKKQEGKIRMWKWTSYWLDLYHRIGGRERERERSPNSKTDSSSQILQTKI
jgi:hypothetical protein